jgi:lipid A disaccharide synthetase
VPEFLQDEVVADRMAPALRDLLDRANPRRQAMVEDLASVRESLGERGAAGRVAALALQMAGAAS